MGVSKEPGHRIFYEKHFQCYASSDGQCLQSNSSISLVTPARTGGWGTIVLVRTLVADEFAFASAGGRCTPCPLMLLWPSDVWLSFPQVGKPRGQSKGRASTDDSRMGSPGGSHCLAQALLLDSHRPYCLLRSCFYLFVPLSGTCPPTLSTAGFCHHPGVSLNNGSSETLP